MAGPTRKRGKALAAFQAISQFIKANLINNLKRKNPSSGCPAISAFPGVAFEARCAPLVLVRTPVV